MIDDLRSQLRSDNKAPPWSDEIEQQFREFVECGQAKRFIDRLNSNEDLEESDPADPLYVAKNERPIYSTTASTRMRPRQKYTTG